MSSYAELKSQAEALFRQAEEARKQELSQVISEIRQKMAEFGLTIEDVAGTGRRATRVTKAKAERIVRFRGPNGEEWTGGPGRKPGWVNAILANGGSLEQYRVA